MSMIDNDWLVPLKKEFSKPYYKDLFEFVKMNTVLQWYIHLQMIFLMHFILHLLKM